MKKDKKEDIYAIRCFFNGKRKFTHQLTKKEAKYFKLCANTLSKYLTESYNLK